MTGEETIIKEEIIRDTPSSESIGGARVQVDRVPEGREMLPYLLTAAAVMALLYVMPFFLSRTAFYDRVNPSFYARPLNYAFDTAGQNADVVIFGDSTALLGVDPSQMSSALGVKVLNLVNTQPTLVVNDDMTLRHYLKANRPPKLLVFYFAPWDFDYGHNDFNSRPTYEGEELLLRRGTGEEMRAFARRHPQELILFPLKFYQTERQLMLHRRPRANQEAQLIATRGHVDNTESTMLTAPCWFPRFLIDNVRFSWVHDLGERYRSPETQVLFYVAPVPACENVSQVLERPYDQLPARPPKPLPPEFFISDVRFIHPRPPAVSQITRDLVDAVRPVLASAH